MQRIGEAAAYELSKQLPWKQVEIQTPLGIHNSMILSEQPVLATILRVGLPLHQGLLNYFDKADNAFISAYRKHHRDGSFEIHLDYISCPSLENRIVILSDCMLATGASIVTALDAMKNEGTPSKVHIVAAVACTIGIEHVVPGLGDAGDLAYGLKIQS